MSENDLSRRFPTVAVGVDGSVGSNEALRWAAAEARMRGTPLLVIHAWSSLQPLIPPLVGYPSGAESVDATADGLRESAEQVLERAVAGLRGVPGLRVKQLLVQGNPAQVLIAAVGNDDLLVVGSRGHGGVASLFLGSVSLQCALHSPCPVVIVRRQQRRQLSVRDSDVKHDLLAVDSRSLHGNPGYDARR